MKINGFEVDKYNQYNIPENAKTWICPECSHTRKKKTQKCMNVYWDTGIGRCNHAGCIVQLHTYKKKNEDKPKNYKKPKSPEQLKNEKDLAHFVNFFEKRGITKITLHKYQKQVKLSKAFFHETKKVQKAITFNHYRENELIHVNYRGSSISNPKMFTASGGTELIFWNLDAIKFAKEVIITEGHPDALIYLQCGFEHTISLPSGSNEKGTIPALDNCLEYFQNKEKIYLAIEDDKAGSATQKEFIRRLGGHRCYYVDYKEEKDGNDFYLKYGADATIEGINNAELYPINNVLTYSDVKDQLYEFYENGSPKGLQTIIMPEFDNLFSTYFGQILTVTGAPRSGKSEFVDSMCTGYALQGYSIAYYSVENMPVFLHVDKIARKISGKRPKNKVELNLNSWKVAENLINEKFNFISDDNTDIVNTDEIFNKDLDSILEIVKELVIRKGVKVLVLDPYNKIPLKNAPQKEHQKAGAFLLKLDLFARTYDVFIILIAHPQKPQGIAASDYRPTMYDIKGGTEFFDMSHHGLAVYRLESHVEIEVLKVKFQNLGELGTVEYIFNTVNNRYQDGLNYDSLIPISNEQSNIEFNQSLDDNSMEQNYENSELENFYDNINELPVPF